jgi:hypothetical protein
MDNENSISDEKKTESKASILIQPRLRAFRPGLQAILALRAEV